MRRQGLQILIPIMLSVVMFNTALAQEAGVGNTASNAGNDYLQKQNAVDRISVINPNTATFGVPLPPSELEGDFYLISEFKQGKFELTTSPKLYEDFMIRYDLRSNLIEINYDDGIRGLDGSKVKYFELLNAKSNYTRYVNANQLDAKGDPLPENKFVEVLIQDDIPLYSYEEISIKKADYNIALNVGSRNDQVIKKPVYLSIVDGQAIELTKGKNSTVYSLLPGKEEELKAFAKQNKIKANSVEDYIFIINKINQMN